jgi:hypothetical protein
MTILQKLACLLVAMGIAFGSAWHVQAWRYDGKLANQAALHLTDLSSISNAATAQVQAEQDKRLATEQRLSAADQQHSRELSDAQRNQTTLRDRLATADVRLSVLLDATSAWFMQPVEPNLTQRMLNELSASPISATKD